MGNPILESIKELRGNRPLFPDQKNANRYKVVGLEEDGSKTAYCFAVPIYTANGRLLDLQFRRCGSGYRADGSNCEIIAGDGFTMKSADGTCRIDPENGFHVDYAGRSVLHGNGCDAAPTANGLVLKARCENGAYRFRFTVDQEFWEARGNGKYFSLMREEFCPAVTISCIGSADESGGIIAPAFLESSAESAGRYFISVVPQSPYAKSVVFEINRYEQKLFQDTTVESKNADVNNVYGGTAFVGETAAFGEQWLYTRPDFSKLPELAGRLIDSVVLHMNRFNSGPELCAFRVERRFCSFGSTWNSRIGDAGKFADAVKGGYRLNFDLTDLAVDRRTGRLRQPDGFIIKAKSRGSGFSVVSTGDSFYAPQILEIRYR